MLTSAQWAGTLHRVKSKRDIRLIDSLCVVLARMPLNPFKDQIRCSRTLASPASRTMFAQVTSRHGRTLCQTLIASDNHNQATTLSTLQSELDRFR